MLYPISGRLFRLTVALTALACLSSSPVRAQATPQLSQRGRFLLEIQELVTKSDFSSLEKLADRVRRGSECLPDGNSKLILFYDTIATSKSDADLAPLVDTLQKWVERSPSSVTARVCLARALVNWAWAARGSGYANTVTSENRKIFQDRLARAKASCDEAAALPPACPGVTDALLTIAIGQGWDRETANSVFQAGVKSNPCLFELYFRRALYLLPRWYGAPGEWERFAASSAKNSPAHCGVGLYFRIAYYMLEMIGPKDFQLTSIDRDLFRASVRQELKAWPNSRALIDRACYLACLINDREFARELFLSYADEWLEIAFPTQASFSDYRRWALAK